MNQADTEQRGNEPLAAGGRELRLKARPPASSNSLLSPKHATKSPTRLRVDRILASLIQTLQAVSQQTHAASEAVGGLTVGTGQVLGAQQTLQDAMRQLHGMGLPQTLEDFGKALREVAKVLENFQEPVVFTPVPMKRVMKSQEEAAVAARKAALPTEAEQ